MTQVLIGTTSAALRKAVTRLVEGGMSELEALRAIGAEYARSAETLAGQVASAAAFDEVTAEVAVEIRNEVDAASTAPPRPSEDEETHEEAETPEAETTVVQVVPLEDRWVVKWPEDGDDRMEAFDTKHEAVQYGVATARDHEPASLRIHKADGTFQEERSYGSAESPAPG